MSNPTTYIAILAPSGAGKTTFINTLDKGLFSPIDCDLVPAIRQLYIDVRAEFGDHWWDHPDCRAWLVPRMIIAMKTAWVQAHSSIPHRVPVLVSAEPILFETALPGTLKIVVIPSMADYKRNLASRGSASDHWWTDDVEKMSNMREKYENVYRRTIGALRLETFDRVPLKLCLPSYASLS